MNFEELAALPECAAEIKRSGLPVYIYGMGNGGEKVLKWCADRGIRAEGAKCQTGEDAIKDTHKVVQCGMSIPLVKKQLAQRQKEAKDLPFHEWYSAYKAEDVFMSTQLCAIPVGEQIDYLNEHPEDFRALFEDFVNGSFFKDIKGNAVAKTGEINIEGMPGIDEIQKRVFINKSNKAIERLTKGNYTSKEAFIEDSAYAIIGQMYMIGGEHLPKDPATGKEISLEQYKQDRVGSKDFVDSLKNPKTGKFVSPDKVVKMACDKEKILNLAKSNTATQKAPQKKQTVNKQKDIKGPKK